VNTRPKAISRGLRLERRLEVRRRFSATVSGVFTVLAFGVSAAIFELMGVNAPRTFEVVFSVYTSPGLFLQAILRGVPIGLAALGLAVAFKTNFWNIGAEGQMFMGMSAATGVVLLHTYQGYVPSTLLMPVMISASFLAGGAFCAIPAALRARLGVNEVLTTLMLNYVAIIFVDYLIHGPWRDPEGHGFPLSIVFPEYAKLQFVADSNSYSGLAMLLATAALVYFTIKHTTIGFSLRVVGENPEAAKHSGISYERAVMTAGLISGGLAGVAGLTVVSGIIGRLRPRASPGYGFTAIIVAFLAGLNPWLIVPASIFFGGLLVAGDVIQASIGLPFAAVQIFQSIIFIFIVAGEFLKRYRLVLRRT